MIRFWLRALGVIGLLGLPLFTHAHPLAPALLELRELELPKEAPIGSCCHSDESRDDGIYQRLPEETPTQYAVLWRTSVARAQRSDVQPQLPADCRQTDRTQVTMESGEALVARWSVACKSEGLAGGTISVTGLDRSGISVILRIEHRDGRVTSSLLDAGQPAFTVPDAGTMPPVFRKYLGLGIEHLLLGLDHVLFVIGLMVLVRRFRPLAVTITAFTIGHSVTLSLATLGLIHVSSALMELGIALSLLVLACEVLRPVPSLLGRRPAVMALSFGLLHGLGFAGTLAEIGLPQEEIPLSLFAFNLGIEAGQLILVAQVLTLAALWRRLPQRFPSVVQPVARTVPAYLIGSLAVFWCLERSTALLI